MKHFNLILSYRRIFKLDEVTKFRLINSFIVSIGTSLIAPVLTVLKGTLFPVWVLSAFGILNTISVKTNEYFTSKSISFLYKLGVIIHILFVLVSLIYFINPLVMIFLDSILVISEIAIFSAYGIKLNNFITDNYPESMQEFQILRNNTWADGTLIGLGLAGIITTLFGIPGMIICFVLFNSGFSAWMIKNWRFYEITQL